MSRLLATAVATLGGVGLMGCAQASASPPAARSTGTGVSVTIPGADRFSPFGVEAAPGQRIVVHNGDADPHTVTSVPGDVEAFDLALPPGASVNLVLHRPGVHRYYCRLHARFDPTTGQVAALSSADHPGEPMSGVVVVVPTG